MKIINVAFPMAVAALVMLLLGIGWWGYHYELPVFIFPLCIGLFVIAMATIASIATYRARDEHAKASETKAAEAQTAAAGHSEAEGLLLERATWIQLGCVLGLMVLCWVLGFIAGIVIFISVYLMCFGWKPWFAALCGFSFGLVIWLLFGLLFVTPLPFWPIFVR
ncbi:MAG TPA: hypothetical protein VGM52_08640 [Herbaspirillum sp.]|jgi:hypothetical protein